MSDRRFLSHRLLPALAALLLIVSEGRTQPPPVVVPNPLAPLLAMPVPLGIQRGTGLDLTLTGSNLAEPVALWTDIPGAKATIPTDNKNGTEAAKLRVRLEVPKETPLGLYGMRLATARGVSNLRLFCVDDLPQVIEADANRSKTTPQVVPVPGVVVGRADAEVSDFFKITVKAGERLSFDVLGRRLGSAFDPQITLIDAKSQKELPGAHSNDAPGLQTDPRLTYTFKEAGEVLVEVRDVMYRGGADYHYRLRIGDFPCATTPIPMAGKRGSKVKVEFAGPNVAGVAPVEVAVPSDPQTSVVWVAPKGPNGLHGWPVALAVSDQDETVEQEPNDEAAKPAALTIPAALTGRFLQKEDIDYFRFPAKKGQRLLFEAETQELYSPTQVYLVVKNAMGAEVAKSNTGVADARIDFTAPADGDYLLGVEHLLLWFGPAETYHLTITPYEPGFDLALQIDRFEVPQGGFTAIGVMATRRDYTGPIEVSVVGSPTITGQAVIPTGAPAAANAPAVQLFLGTKPDAPLGPALIQVQGKATINGKVVVRNAIVKTFLTKDLGGLAYPPLQYLDRAAVSVSAKPPFTLTAKFDQPESLRGAAANITVTAARSAGFTEDITLAALALPANVAPVVKPIAKNTNEIKVQLTPAANAALGSFTISFTGKAKYQGKDVTVTAAPVDLVIALPFELQVEPKPVTLAPGGKAKVKVTATRKAGYQGPIDVELKNLPANVTAPKATIPMGQPAVEVELTATATAAIGDKADVNATGTAPAAANQQNASPAFTVSVKK